jgi:C-terminal processing protease CtpA/Prc
VRRLLVLLLAAGVLVGVGGAFILSSPAALNRVWPHLPRWIQTRPSLYLETTLGIIRGQALRRDTVDWPAVVAHAKDMARDATSAEATYPAIRYVLDELGDGHSMLIPAPTATPIPGPTGAYGLQTLYPDRIVAVVYPRSAAAAADIRAGDVIELVNGQPPQPSPSARSRGHFVDIPAPSVVLRLRHPGEAQARDVALSVGPYVPLPALTRRLSGDLGYVEIPGTTGGDNFAARVRESIYQSDAPTVCGWIVDLRFNNGGSLWAMLQALRPILGEGTLGFFVRPDGRRTPWEYPTTGPLALPAAEHPLQRPDPIVAVLTSRLTSSAGEAAAIAFRGRPSTRVFGEPTWGIPAGNDTFALPDGAILELATMRAADRTGRILDGPLPPDEAVPIDWSRLTAADDPVIVAAGTWIRAQPPCKK